MGVRQWMVCFIGFGYGRPLVFVRPSVCVKWSLTHTDPTEGMKALGDDAVA